MGCSGTILNNIYSPHRYFHYFIHPCNCFYNYIRSSKVHRIHFNNNTFTYQFYLFSANNEGESKYPHNQFSYNSETGLVNLMKFTSDCHEGIPIFSSVIGLEVHVQLNTPTKLFSSTPTRYFKDIYSDDDNIFNSEHSPSLPNTQVNPHDLSYPGYLPLLSYSSILQAIQVASLLNCTIYEKSRFERKHYHYSDLPAGYQITQQHWPLASNGYLLCRRDMSLAKNTDEIDNKPKNIVKQRKKIYHSSYTNMTDIYKNKTIETKSEDNVKGEYLSKFFRVGIDRVQIEHDTGRTKHIMECRKPLSFVDLNRSGCALLEVVFRPDVKSSNEAIAVLSTLRSLLRYIDVCDGKMENGSLRCDLNISITPIVDNDTLKTFIYSENPFQNYFLDKIGKRVEVKNLNSFKHIRHAIEFEVLRQVRTIILDQIPTEQETRTFHKRKKITIRTREKVCKVDYRFMPDPDLAPLVLNEVILEGKTLKEYISNQLPPDPEMEIKRLMDQYGLSERFAIIIATDRYSIDFFENTVNVARQKLLKMNERNNEKPLNSNLSTPSSLELVEVTVSKWICNEVFSLSNESALTKGITNGVYQSHLDRKSRTRIVSKISSGGKNEELNLNNLISAQYSILNSTRLGELMALILDETVTKTRGKKILEIMFKEPRIACPAKIIELQGWRIIKDPEELANLCWNIVLDPSNSFLLDQYKKGGKYIKKITEHFIGKLMTASNGNAHPKVLRTILKEVLEKLVSENKL